MTLSRDQRKRAAHALMYNASELTVSRTITGQYPNPDLLQEWITEAPATKESPSDA